MANNGLVVYREYFGRFEEVGRVAPMRDGMGFSYSEESDRGRGGGRVSPRLGMWGSA